MQLNPLSANPTKWSNTLKQFVGKLPTTYLSVFNDFVGLALKGLSKSSRKKKTKVHSVFTLGNKVKRILKNVNYPKLLHLRCGFKGDRGNQDPRTRTFGSEKGPRT